MKRRCINGDEQDAIHARRLFHWRAGEVSKVKRAIRRRERHEHKRIDRDSGRR